MSLNKNPIELSGFNEGISTTGSRITAKWNPSNPGKISSQRVYLYNNSNCSGSPAFTVSTLGDTSSLNVVVGSLGYYTYRINIEFSDRDTTTSGCSPAIQVLPSTPSFAIASFAHTTNLNNFDISWTGDTLSGLCAVEYFDGSAWQQSGADQDCSADLSTTSFTITAPGNSWNGHTVRVRKISNSAILAANAGTLQCAVTAGSVGTSTPTIDEDCDGDWNNTSVGSPTWGPWIPTMVGGGNCPLGAVGFTPTPGAACTQGIYQANIIVDRAGSYYENLCPGSMGNGPELWHYTVCSATTTYF